MVVGHVLDMDSMLAFAAKMYSVLGSVVTVLLQVATTTSGDDEHATIQCTLTKGQIATVKAAFVGANTTCSYDNVTIGSALVS